MIKKTCYTFLALLISDDDQIYENGRYLCCKCPEGVQLQKEIVEHLINSCDFFITESDKQNSSSSSFILEVNLKNSIETDEDTKKSKPSYHSQYNKRERSPETEKIQSEFTKCDEMKIYYCNFCRNRYKQKQTVERHLLKEHDPRTKEVNEKEPTNQEKPIFYCSICRNGYKVKKLRNSMIQSFYQVLSLFSINKLLNVIF